LKLLEEEVEIFIGEWSLGCELGCDNGDVEVVVVEMDTGGVVGCDGVMPG
jgi:hypothetical protein